MSACAASVRALAAEAISANLAKDQFIADGHDVAVVKVPLVLNRRKHKIPVPLLRLAIATHRKRQFPHDVRRARHQRTCGFLANDARPVEEWFREGLPMASGPPARPKYARFAFSTMNSLRRKTAIGSAILSRSLLTGLCVPTTVPKCSSRRAETRAISSRDEKRLDQAVVRVRCLDAGADDEIRFGGHPSRSRPSVILVCGPRRWQHDSRRR